MKAKYLMCNNVKKYKVNMYSKTCKQGSYNGTYIVFAPSSRKAILKACIASGIPSLTCLSQCYYGGLISLSSAMKFLTSSKGLGIYAFAC